MAQDKSHLIGICLALGAGMVQRLELASEQRLAVWVAGLVWVLE